MRDHTMGLNPGNGSPSALLADNDYAVGELVEAVSKSPIWDSTAIIVVEDDSQFSSDHIDTHRSFVQVISPWIKKSTVDHRFYDTNSILKTIELLLGVGPMSQHDHFATPTIGGWDSAPHNDAAYSAILPAKSIIGQVNPSVAAYAPNDPRRQLAELSSQMNWKVADAVPTNVLNQVLWADVKGADSAMPALRETTLALSGVPQPASGGDGDD